jgi:DNA polymerase-4/protein ImuB
MLDALEHVSPIVEAGPPGTAYLDLTGLPGTGNPAGEAALAEQMIAAVRDAVQMTPRAGITDGRFAAWAAAMSVVGATTGPRFHVVAPGEAGAFVGSLPVVRLPLSDETLRRLNWLGLRSIGELAELPQGALAAQFGPEGVLMSDLARGAGGGPLIPRRLAPAIADTLDFPQPSVEAPAILAGSRILLSRLLRRPECAGRAVHGLTLDAALSNGHRRRWDLTFREPTGDRDRMLRALAAKLEGEAFSAPVESLALTLHDLCGETGFQSNLFSTHARHLHSLEAALGQLRARFGRPLVMKIVGVEPWSRIPERQFALVDYEPSTVPSP